MRSFKWHRQIFWVRTIMVMMLLLAIIGCDRDKPPVTGNPLEFTYLTEEYPPFNYTENGQLNGVAVDILEELFNLMDLPVDRSDISVANWVDAFEYVRSTPGTMLFSMVRSAEREALFKWVGPIAPHTEITVSLSGSVNQINELTDLNNYFTGVLDGYNTMQMLIDHGVLRANIVNYGSLSELYSALVDTREIQFLATSEATHNLIIQDLGYAPSIFNRPFIILTNEIYYAFNIETADQMIDEFQAALDLHKQDKTVDGSSAYEKILNRFSIIRHIADDITDQMVTDLVDLTAADLHKDAAGTISKVNQGLHPYKDKDTPALYSFFYNTDVVMIAHAGNPLMAGVSFKGKPDVAGRNFRDEIVAGALANGSGWVDYIYTMTDRSGLYYKTTYYKLTTGSDGNKYIVCAGKFK